MARPPQIAQQRMPSGGAVLELRDIHVRFATPDGEVHAVKGIDIDVSRGETVAIVGESGSGKSQAMMAAMGLLAANGARDRLGRATAARRSSACRPRALNRIRGAKITMIFQEPMTSLDPLYRVGDQIAEPLIEHGGMSLPRGARARRRAPAAGADAAAGASRQLLSARAFRRPAAARHDRHGARQRPRRADRRRADHRSRRDHPGADPGAL